MTDDELKRLAKDFWAGRIFSDRHVRTTSDLLLVFMPLGLSSPEQLQELAEKIGDKGMIYQHLDRAGPTVINGYPVFFSFKTLTSEEAHTMLDYVRRIEEAVDRA